jgi:hypothetical protein
MYVERLIKSIWYSTFRQQFMQFEPSICTFSIRQVFGDAKIVTDNSVITELKLSSGVNV